ncbi:MAG: hypothetical protein IPJ33_11355 [Gammaproteobacteria bacterium]|nr:hypothetical protein [Gammaproteobacteria bacterium]MBP6050939.1 hypothetical protein [Pseudomonadales bacterium]MBK6582446.1 hypothetical protein [Gammaproteobacteria bacterium]MBK7169591.1 hypothetical protein [Gammaproteobacteria bacterium]MBK7521286.1 hypothetical protein [Gammaproteobacteria bacterium]
MHKQFIPALPATGIGGLALAIFLAISPSLHAQVCAFSQEQEQAVLQNANTRYPGGVLAREKREVNWALPDGGSTTFGYGGCDHLGSLAFRSVRAPAALGQEEVIAAGRELAEQFWNARILGDSLALDTLVSGLDRKDFIVELSRGKTFINVRDAAFAELYIEHSYENGFDSVGIVWQKQP